MAIRSIMIACSNGDIRSYFEDLASQIDRVAPQVVIATTIEQASELYDHTRPDLVIIEADIKSIDSSPKPATKRHPGVTLVREWKGRASSPPVILISRKPDSVLTNTMIDLSEHRTWLLCIDKDTDRLFDRIVARIMSLSVPKGEPTAIVEIVLRSDLHTQYTIHLRDAFGEDQQPITCDLDKYRLNWTSLMDIKDLAGAIGESIGTRHWLKSFTAAGRQLFNHLSVNGFDKELQNALRYCDNKKKNLGIRFTVGREAYSLPLEALYFNDEHLALKAPIVRCISNSPTIDRLVVDSVDRLRILFIEADVGEDDKLICAAEDPLSRSGPHLFDTLKNLKAERLYFEDRSKRANEPGPIVTYLRRREVEETGSQTFRERLRETLTGGRGGPKPHFDIVHFAGHSVATDGSAKDEDRGCLILPAPDGAEPLRIQTFANWLEDAGVKFVYLSSCHSSEADAAFALANAGIPVVVGFRWKIQDDLAAEFAGAFYNQLLRNTFSTCEEAFLAARQEMYDRHETESIWAAPVMILQSRKWHALARQPESPRASPVAA